MRAARTILSLFSISILGVCAHAQQVSSDLPAPGKRIVIAASTVLDGKGRVLRDTRIVIEGAKIVALDSKANDSKSTDPKANDPKAAPVDYDLRGLTVLPGWIDAHVHLAWFFARMASWRAPERLPTRPHLPQPPITGSL